MALYRAVASGKKKHRSRTERAVSLCGTGCPLPALLLAPFFFFFRAVFDSRSSFFALKPHGNAFYAGYRGPREQCRSMPQGDVKKKGSVADRESGVAVPLGGVKKKKDRSRT